MSIKKIFIIGIIIGLLIPFISRAQIKITEIMYDPQGSDTKREWIEILNTGTTNVDLNSYFFFENNVFHKLVAGGESLLAPGSYAIIVDSIVEVVADYAEFMGQIFDSTFSLNNTGETISIANSAKEIIDTAIYSSDMGANNDGNSLQITDNQIITAGPTFGQINKTESENPVGDDNSNATSTTDSDSTSGVSTHVQQENISKYTPSTTFKIGAGRDRVVSINSPIEFKAAISNADTHLTYRWNFGDFNLDKGRQVEHTYEYEGIYEVVLEGKSSGHTGISRTEVQVIIPQLVFEISTSTLHITNKSKQEINIGDFMVGFTKGPVSAIPRNSIIKGGATVHLSYSPDKVLQDFLYPNGEIYMNFDTI